ncbi:MAG: hypothetical protein RBR52_11640 [Thiomonas sp.]|uniref:hypothetical protein n=1 Tax=Thiomonas sp. TaxID=2047785 RepID=UPI002A35ED94|nr:hypothetical protein [Thiomonas sp.]MDY0331130.1 hypothetical protein [Thiomonas sp.]
MLPINVLRQIQTLFPSQIAALDGWQQNFVRDQLQRFQKFGDDTHISEKQAQALEKCLTAMQKRAKGAEEGGAL